MKRGGFIVLEGEPCRVVEVARSAPGKHGGAKVRIVAIGLLDSKKRSVVYPVDTKVDVPIIAKGKATVTYMDTGRGIVQLMDLETYETFEMPIQDELKGELTSGINVEYWQLMGRRLIMRVEK